MKKIVLFASGSGTNAENIILHFENSEFAEVAAVFSNNPDAMVLERAKKYDVPTFVFTKEDFRTQNVLGELYKLKPDLIVLAGFLLQISQRILSKPIPIKSSTFTRLYCPNTVEKECMACMFTERFSIIRKQKQEFPFIMSIEIMMKGN